MTRNIPTLSGNIVTIENVAYEQTSGDVMTPKNAARTALFAITIVRVHKVMS